MDMNAASGRTMRVETWSALLLLLAGTYTSSPSCFFSFASAVRNRPIISSLSLTCYPPGLTQHRNGLWPILQRPRRGLLRFFDRSNPGQIDFHRHRALQQRDRQNHPVAALEVDQNAFEVVHAAVIHAHPLPDLQIRPRLTGEA